MGHGAASKASERLGPTLRFSARVCKLPQSAPLPLESLTMEEGEACDRLASEFFYGFVGQTQTRCGSRRSIWCVERDLLVRSCSAGLECRSASGFRGSPPTQLRRVSRYVASDAPERSTLS